jgi:hypothetical protein
MTGLPFLVDQNKNQRSSSQAYPDASARERTNGPLRSHVSGVTPPSQPLRHRPSLLALAPPPLLVGNLAPMCSQAAVVEQTRHWVQSARLAPTLPHPTHYNTHQRNASGYLHRSDLLRRSSSAPPPCTPPASSLLHSRRRPSPTSCIDRRW